LPLPCYFRTVSSQVLDSHANEKPTNLLGLPCSQRCRNQSSALREFEQTPCEIGQYLVNAAPISTKRLPVIFSIESISTFREYSDTKLWHALSHYFQQSRQRLNRIIFAGKSCECIPTILIIAKNTETRRRWRQQASLSFAGVLEGQLDSFRHGIDEINTRNS
jgi:hypothetical protein